MNDFVRLSNCQDCMCIGTICGDCLGKALGLSGQVPTEPQEGA